MCVLKQIVGPILLRRTKSSVDDKGNIILKLPGKNLNVVKVIMQEEERKVYDSLYEQSRNKFLFFLRNGTALKNFSGIFAMIMRLRQCCDHPSLIYRALENNEVEEEIRNFLLDKVENKKKISEESDDETEENDPYDNNMMKTNINEDFLENNEEINTFLKNSIPELIEKMKENNFENCPICFSDMIEPTLTKCCHIACFECLSKAIRLNNTCPICRSLISQNQIRKISRYFS